MDKTTENVPDLKFKLAEMVMLNQQLRATCKDAVNELCYRCGEYQREHLGACNGCRWKEVRHSGQEVQ